MRKVVDCRVIRRPDTSNRLIVTFTRFSFCLMERAIFEGKWWNTFREIDVSREELEMFELKVEFR